MLQNRGKCNCNRTKAVEAFEAALAGAHPTHETTKEERKRCGMSMEQAKAPAAELGIGEAPGKRGAGRRRGGHPGPGLRNERAAARGGQASGHHHRGDPLLQAPRLEAPSSRSGSDCWRPRPNWATGEWLPLLRDRVDLSERSAQNFMRLARSIPNPQRLRIWEPPKHWRCWLCRNRNGRTSCLSPTPWTGWKRRCRR